MPGSSCPPSLSLPQLTNGCICCTLRGDLAEEVGRLAATGCYDYCVIESTGIGEPMQVGGCVGHGGTRAEERRAQHVIVVAASRLDGMAVTVGAKCRRS